MVNNSGELFLLTTKLYNSTNHAAFLEPDQRKPEGNSYVHPEGTAAKNQEQNTTKKIMTQKTHTNKLHTNLGHIG